MVTLKIQAWLGRVEIAVKQKIKKTLQLANKKSGKTFRMNPSWTRIFIILLYLRHFFTSQISTMLRPSSPKYHPISEPETPHVITSFQSSRFIIHDAPDHPLIVYNWGLFLFRGKDLTDLLRLKDRLDLHPNFCAQILHLSFY